ncbi:MAG: hypothetical protein HDS65_06340 [Bacteroidales bacterium]|nr:hypothetical protein [Bacteroidales bacterium]
MSIYDDFDKIKNKAALESYELLLKNDTEITPIEFNSVGITLHSMIGVNNPHQILSILKDLKLPDEYKLGYTHYISESFGQYDVVVVHTNGKQDKNIFNYLNVEESKMGVWQAYLLNTLWHTLPLNDHSNYSARKFIYSVKDIESLYIKEDNIRKKCLKSNVDIHVVGLRDFYYVSCCYWCRFTGLNRVVCEIQIRDNRVININEVSRVVLVEYGRNIRL